MARVLVVGVGGALGCEIAINARQLGHTVTATYRTNSARVSFASRSGVKTEHLELNDPGGLEQLIDGADISIFTPILTLSKTAARFVRDKRAVFFSSNNVAIDQTADVYRELRDAEAYVSGSAPNALIIRPTMIYGFPGDGNISRLAAWMQRSPIFAMPGDGSALQQPIFYRDLAQIALSCALEEPKPEPIVYAAGPISISQSQLFETVGRARGGQKTIFPIPLKPLLLAVAGLERIGLRGPVSHAQLRRVLSDKRPAGNPVRLGQTDLSAGVAAICDALDDRQARS